MFSKKSYKPFMKGSFSGGRGLTSSFINDRCLWGAHLVGLQGAGVSATVFLPALHSVWHLRLVCQASQRAGLTHQTVPKGQLGTTRQKGQNIWQKEFAGLPFPAFRSLLLCISVWQSDCGVSTRKANAVRDVSSGPYVGPVQANSEEQRACRTSEENRYLFNIDQEKTLRN